jgi:predicted DCC family thiol-disulfide oxidoreductase YuxK
MANEPRLRISHPPPQPLMIWDGECHFCRRWIERWREITRGAVDYETYQEATQRFPEIPRQQFQHAVVLIDKNGEVFTAAEAVYRSLRCRSSRKWLAWSYYHVPGFAAISELAYKFIARHRGLASAVTRLLWGSDVRPPTYFWARRWFLRVLAAIYLIAFISLWTQIDGLVGSNGILPITNHLAAAREQLGHRAWSIFPTLCWSNSSNAFLHFLCGGGVALSLLLLFGVVPGVSLILLFAFYLSLTVAGQVFLSFQWDILLLETGFLSVFLAPPQLWPKRGREPPPSRPAIFLLKFLLFKLMVMSGVVKLTSGDDCWGWFDHSFHWSALTALDYHYWSQPLPTIFAWWADKSPEWFKHFSVAFCLGVEIIVPIFIWTPRRLRLMACGFLIFLQIAIAITGNYCFFNLLTIALCLLLIDDTVTASLGEGRALPLAKRPRYPMSTLAATIVIVVTLPLNAWHILSAFKPDAETPRTIQFAYEYLQPIGVVSGYGLFRVMTKDRREIVIEGSADGIEWQPYEFKWKPGDVMRAPGWCAPHQPRLDWQMWFAALGSRRERMWFFPLMVRLLEGQSEVTGLMARNAFTDKPPRYIRAILYRYRFTTTDEHRQTGAWWKRQELGEYFGSFSLDDLERVR